MVCNWIRFLPGITWKSTPPSMAVERLWSGCRWPVAVMVVWSRTVIMWTIIWFTPVIGCVVIVHSWKRCIDRIYTVPVGRWNNIITGRVGNFYGGTAGTQPTAPGYNNGQDNQVFFNYVLHEKIRFRFWLLWHNRGSFRSSLETDKEIHGLLQHRH